MVHNKLFLNVKLFLFTVIVLISNTGCVTVNYKEPIASFQSSINTSGTAIGTYFSNLNAFERQVYIDGIALDANQEIFAEISGSPTPLKGQKFSASSIKARMDAITLLGVYAQRLSDLAGSNAPQQFSSSMSTLGDNLKTLDNTFSTVLPKSDPTAANYVGPISQLIGSIGKMYLEHQQEVAIREAIDKGAPQVLSIIDLLEKDLLIVKDAETTGTDQILATKVAYYNKQRKTMSLEARTAFLAEIQDASTANSAAIALNPSNLTQSMRQTMNALVKYADSPKTPQNFSDLMSSLQTFNQNAQEISSEVQNIFQIKKGK